LKKGKNKKIKKIKKNDIYQKYREILKNPNLSKKEIDKMRHYLQIIAKVICEYVWESKSK